MSELFGNSKRFESSSRAGPKIEGFVNVRSWKNIKYPYVPKQWDRIGNVKECYHGTSLEALARIAEQSLLRCGTSGSQQWVTERGAPLSSRRLSGWEPGTFGHRRWRSGMFGEGIYVAPHPMKAWLHTRPDEQQKRYLLKGRIALGKSLVPDMVMHYDKKTLTVLGYDSITARGGKLTGVYKGFLTFDEYVVFDPIQVVVDFVFEYKEGA